MDPPLPVVTGTPERCSIRVSDRGITVDGDPMPRASAVALCKRRSSALVDVEDDANRAEWTQLRAALVSAASRADTVPGMSLPVAIRQAVSIAAAGVTILMRGAPANDVCTHPLATGCVRVPARSGCADNPLVKGCR